ncbi:uncharacterized protein KY384_008050 [Bacidia gigantensis]|uniref:uncharacterized protein n=1 Tax=Bacidia gigantensis TaxID=2732470 RepID=UPI001D03C1F4|nr:uncharacterized protein KY384_008050 [Bacidia gigantensis]KAG8527306.1 hypothetical protein KY384_008050 [Bacidia gigantensis]
MKKSVTKPSKEGPKTSAHHQHHPRDRHDTHDTHDVHNVNRKPKKSSAACWCTVLFWGLSIAAALTIFELAIFAMFKTKDEAPALGRIEANSSSTPQPHRLLLQSSLEIISSLDGSVANITKMNNRHNQQRKHDKQNRSKKVNLRSEMETFQRQIKGADRDANTTWKLIDSDIPRFISSVDPSVEHEHLRHLVDRSIQMLANTREWHSKALKTTKSLRDRLSTELQPIREKVSDYEAKMRDKQTQRQGSRRPIGERPEDRQMHQRGLERIEDFQWMISNLSIIETQVNKSSSQWNNTAYVHKALHDHSRKFKKLQEMENPTYAMFADRFGHVAWTMNVTRSCVVKDCEGLLDGPGELWPLHAGNWRP